MDCRDAQFYLRLRRHAADELGPDVNAPLRDHLAGCPACARESRALESFDRALASAMLRVPVPVGLRGRLIADVASKQGALLRQRAYKAGGLVAAALVLVGIGVGVWTGARPALDVSALVERNGEQFADAEGSTQKWLTAQKLPEQLPLPFDYDLLTYRGHEQVQGREVPVLVFRSRHGSGFAKVYIFGPNARFDLKSVAEANDSNARAEAPFVKQDARGTFTYVCVHTAGPNGLEQFLRTNRAVNRA
jgi:hypothetical protein